MHVEVVQETTSPAVGCRRASHTTVSGGNDSQSSGFSSAAASAAAAGEIPEGTRRSRGSADVHEAADRGQGRVGRQHPANAPCPCGSGKKFKQCHGAA